jgi:signal transduction histidine kinase
MPSTGDEQLAAPLSEGWRAQSHRPRASSASPEGELAAAVAHQLKDRLAGISAGLQLLARELLEGDPRRAVLDDLRGELRRVDAMAVDLLEFAHPCAPRVQPADLRGLLFDVLAGVSLDPDVARHRLQVSIDEDLLLPIDPQLLGHTLQSLVLDAARAIPAPGTIALHASRCGRSAIVELSDTGPPLASADRQAVFEPFPAHRSRGSGLAFALARRNIEAHGGRLELCEDAAQERAARFRVELPLGPAAAQQVPASREQER